MKYVLVILGILVSLLLTADARLTGEIIYRHPEYVDELWIASLGAPGNGRLLFKHTQDIFEVATENNGTRIAIVTEFEQNFDFKFHVYLVDMAHPERKARNLARHRFEEVWGIDIDAKGNVLFTNSIIGGEPPPKVEGVYLIPEDELDRPSPHIRQLQQVIAYQVVGLPSGKEVVYQGDGGIFLLDTSTKAVLRVCRKATSPAVSADGKLLAFVHRLPDNAYEIEIISLETLRTVKIIEPDIGESDFGGIKFYPGGNYLVYAIRGGPFSMSQLIAVPLDGGPSFTIWEMHRGDFPVYDWWNVPYAVEPAKKVTTLWGQLKVDMPTKTGPEAEVFR